MKPKFINIDLEISTDSKPKHIISSMGQDVFVLYSGPRENHKCLTAIEIAFPRKSSPIQIDKVGPSTPELLTIRCFTELLDKLSLAAQNEWNAAKQKVFDIGYDAEPEAKVIDIDIDPRIAPLIEKYGATMRVTVYRYEDREVNGVKP